jgi:2-haloacid dehalogenase
MTLKTPHAVMFDLGGVLVDWDPRYLYRDVFADSAEMEDFLSGICTMRWHAAHDRGRSMAENRAPLIAEFPAYEAAITMWDTHWPSMFDGVIDGVAPIIESLNIKGFPLFGLSNLPAEKAGHIRAAYPIISTFRDLVISGEEGVAKPDQRIYEIAVDRSGFDAADILFVDDRLENVDAAAALGMDGVHFVDAERLRESFARRGVIV